MTCCPPRPPPPIDQRRIAYIRTMVDSDRGCEFWALHSVREALRDLLAHIDYLEADR